MCRQSAVPRVASPQASPVVVDGAKGGADTGGGAPNALNAPPSPSISTRAAPRRSRDADDLADDDLADDFAALSPAERFVARHRLALIGRVRGVAALLDRLEADGVLSAEEAAAVAAGPTPQEQMRRLLATAPAWGRRGHRRFLRAVRCLHPHLMEDLGDAPEGDP